MKVTKDKISSNISSEVGITKQQSQLFVNSFIDLFKNAIIKNTIKIHKFGTFYEKLTKKRIGRNPKTLEQHVISPKNKIYFKASNTVKKNINWYNYNHY